MENKFFFFNNYKFYIKYKMEELQLLVLKETQVNTYCLNLYSSSKIAKRF